MATVTRSISTSVDVLVGDLFRKYRDELNLTNNAIFETFFERLTPEEILAYLPQVHDITLLRSDGQEQTNITAVINEEHLVAFYNKLDSCVYNTSYFNFTRNKKTSIWMRVCINRFIKMVATELPIQYEESDIPSRNVWNFLKAYNSIHGAGVAV